VNASGARIAVLARDELVMVKERHVR